MWDYCDVCGKLFWNDLDDDDDEPVICDNCIDTDDDDTPDSWRMEDDDGE